MAQGGERGREREKKDKREIFQIVKKLFVSRLGFLKTKPRGRSYDSLVKVFTGRIIVV